MDSLVQYLHPPVYAMTHTKVVLAASVTVNSNLDILFHIHMKIFTTSIVSLSPRAQDWSQDILLSGSG